MQQASANIGRGYRALRNGEWKVARREFEEALAKADTPEALEGLSQAWWWEGDEEQALAYRQRAHSGYRRRGDRVPAVRCALWVSDEYRVVYGDQAAANGWFSRAQRLLADETAGGAVGWVALARAARTDDPSTAAHFAEQALAEAERTSDSELEIYGLASLGKARVTKGEVKAGLADLDEAMALATSQENLVVAGDVACSLMQSAELIGDLSPFMTWAPLVERYVTQLGHHKLIASCGTCCGEVFAANGDWTNAERELVRTIAALERSGHRSRCSHPVAALASLRIRQGRLEEAEAILAPYSALPEAVEPMAQLLIAQNHHQPAIKLLQRRLTRIGSDNLRSVPLLSLLAQAHTALNGRNEAARVAAQLEDIAMRSGLGRVRGLAELARARSCIDPGDAIATYEQAIDLLEANSAPLEAAIAHFELSRLLKDADRDSAVTEARLAASNFDRLGARQLSDQAAAFLRSLGVRGQTGPKRNARLTARESEVLDLIARGMTNAEIATRLFISQKTAANHVSNVLMKLGVRSRTEAAAVALIGN
jgi:DNA-binding CsgD family transcriptional regulator